MKKVTNQLKRNSEEPVSSNIADKAQEIISSVGVLDVSFSNPNLFPISDKKDKRVGFKSEYQSLLVQLENLKQLYDSKTLETNRLKEEILRQNRKILELKQFIEENIK